MRHRCVTQRVSTCVLQIRQLRGWDSTSACTCTFLICGTWVAGTSHSGFRHASRAASKDASGNASKDASGNASKDVSRDASRDGVIAGSRDASHAASKDASRAASKGQGAASYAENNLDTQDASRQHVYAHAHTRTHAHALNRPH